MNKMIARAGVTLALLALTAGSVLAAPPKKGDKMAGAKCPVCHMVLSAKKTKATPVAMKVGGKTLYCCSHCDMKPKKGAKKGKM